MLQFSLLKVSFTLMKGGFIFQNLIKENICTLNNSPELYISISWKQKIFRIHILPAAIDVGRLRIIQKEGRLCGFHHTMMKPRNILTCRVITNYIFTHVCYVGLHDIRHKIGRLEINKI